MVAKKHDFDAAWKAILEAFEVEIVELLFPEIFKKIDWELGTESLGKELLEIQKDIFDKENNREVLAKNQRGNVLQMFEDKPRAHEAWDIDIYYQEKMREVTDLQNVCVVENGNLKAVVRFNYKYMNTTINQDMVVYKNDRRIQRKV